MQEIRPEDITHAQIQSGMIKCSCGSPFFIKHEVNTYRDIDTSLYGPVRSFNPGESLSLLECIQCRKTRLPDYGYYGLLESDLKLVKYLKQLIDKRNEHETPLS